jgi:predicted DNA-binding transcriptional regulator YafY
MSQTERLYWIDAQIHDRRYPNAEKVCDHFGVSLRTAYVDHDYLRTRLNAPIAYDRERGGWHYTEETFMLPFLALSAREASGLRRSLLAAQEYLSAEDARAVRLLLDRFAAYLPGGQAAESISGSMHFAAETEIEPALLEACRQAVRNRQKLFLRYFSAHRNETDERVVHPYHLHYHQGEPHLLAWCEWRQEVRQFFLGRMLKWELLEPDAAFVRDPTLDVDAYWRQGLGLQHGEPPVTVRVRFSAYQALWIRERRYHASQQIEEQVDGSLILTLHVSGMAEVRRWLLSYGAEVEVLEPPELRNSIAEQIKKLVELYLRPSE